MVYEIVGLLVTASWNPKPITLRSTTVRCHFANVQRMLATLFAISMTRIQRNRLVFVGRAVPCIPW